MPLDSNKIDEEITNTSINTYNSLSKKVETIITKYKDIELGSEYL